MICERIFNSFKELYDEQLRSRGFDIFATNGDVLIAKYSGTHPLREPDGDLQAMITREEDKWILRVDTRFYVDRVRFSLAQPSREVRGYNGTSPLYMVARVLTTVSLDQGAISYPMKTPIHFPYREGELGLGVARLHVQHYKSRQYEFVIDGMNDREKKLLGLQ